MEHNNIILLHGALGSRQQFDSLTPLISEHFNVHTLNFEGHGDRYSDNDFSISNFASNVKDYLVEQKISKTHIFGYSMGGYVALKLALNNTSLVDKIITLGTKFNWTKEIAANEVKMLNPQKTEEKVPAFAKRLEEIHTRNDWKYVMLKTALMMTELGNGKKLNDVELEKIEQNVLIGIGGLDRMVTKEESKHAAELLPNGSIKVIDDFKHPIEKVNMNQLGDLIINFLT